MPRMRIIFTVLATVTVCIGFNIAYYPAVWEMSGVDPQRPGGGEVAALLAAITPSAAANPPPASSTEAIPVTPSPPKSAMPAAQDHATATAAPAAKHALGGDVQSKPASKPADKVAKNKKKPGPDKKPAAGVAQHPDPTKAAKPAEAKPAIVAAAPPEAPKLVPLVRAEPPAPPAQPLVERLPPVSGTAIATLSPLPPGFVPVYPVTGQ